MQIYKELIIVQQFHFFSHHVTFTWYVFYVWHACTCHRYIDLLTVLFLINLYDLCAWQKWCIYRVSTMVVWHTSKSKRSTFPKSTHTRFTGFFFDIQGYMQRNDFFNILFVLANIRWRCYLREETTYELEKKTWGFSRRHDCRWECILAALRFNSKSPSLIYREHWEIWGVTS